MIHAIEVDLSGRGLLFPRAGVGMVVAQPFLDLTAHEPFTCTVGSKQSQLDAIKATLQVSREATHGADKTQFTVFPECSIPGLDGIAIIDSAVAAAVWPSGTVVIGGIDGLTREQFIALAQAPSTHLDVVNNSLDRLQAHEWVNCSITWIKFPNGAVERWLQPKIAPAWVERDFHYQSMFQGRSVFVFKGLFDNQASWYRFCSLLCFDWVAEVEGKRVWQWVAKSLGEVALAAQADISLSWVFVVQCNPQPSHPSFLSQVEGFFDQTIQSNVLRNNACLVMANTAGRPKPGRVTKFGSSSVVHSAHAIFTKPDCSPTYGNGGPRQRASNQLGQLRDALFRENGACIHSFFQTNPASLVPGAAGKNYAIARAAVYPLDDDIDPRTPSALVPACTKWINDDLDDGAKSLAMRYPAETLSIQAAGAHTTLVTALRGIEPPAAEKAIRMACPTCGKTADDWDTVESKALEHVLQTLTVLGVAKTQPTVHGQPTHATITIGERTLEMVAIRADTHESCSTHLKNHPPVSRRPLIVVSRDEDNTEWPKRLQSFLDTSSDNSEEKKYADPTSAVCYVGYCTILNAFRHAQTEDQLSGELDVVFNA